MDKYQLNHKLVSSLLLLLCIFASTAAKESHQSDETYQLIVLMNSDELAPGKINAG